MGSRFKLRSAPVKTQPLPTVDVQILCGAFEPVDRLELEAAIVMAALAQGVAERDCKLLDNSTATDKRFLCGNFHVLVTQSIPFEASDRLKAALNTFSVRSTFPDAADIVSATHHCISISIRKSLIPADMLPAAAHEFVLSEDTAFSDASETWSALEMARIISCIVFDKTRPAAVFWGPSLFLLKPDTFAECSRAGNQNYLYMQPSLHGHNDPETGEQLVGVTGLGSPWLIGYSLEIKPCALPPDYLVQTMFAFLAFTQKTEKLIAGDVFGRDENEKVKVLVHEAAEGQPASIELKVVHKPEFGIVQDQVPTIRKHYDDDCKVIDETVIGGEETDLDPDDPVDAAILEHLAALRKKSAGIGSEVSEAQRDRDFTELDPPAPALVKPSAPETAAEKETQSEPPPPEFSKRATRPATPPAKRVSMEELRGLAQKAQADAEASVQSQPKRGFLGKLFGK